MHAEEDMDKREPSYTIGGNVNWYSHYGKRGFLGGARGKEPTCQCRKCKRVRFYPWVRKTLWRAWQSTLVYLPGESHGLKSLAGYSP